jgi:hypothetical protein
VVENAVMRHTIISIAFLLTTITAAAQTYGDRVSDGIVHIE